MSEWECIIVENSPDRYSVEIVQSEFPWVRLLCNGTNLGFGGGHNWAFQESSLEYFFVLNPDILVLENSVETLIDYLDRHPSASVAGPCLLNPDGSVQYSARRFYDWKTVLGRRLPIWNREAIDDWHLMRGEYLSQTQNVDWVMGAAMAVRRQAFPHKILFDPRYKLYFEDVDLCYFTQKKKWDVAYCPESKMVHDHQRASAKGINRLLWTHFISWVKFWLKTKFES